MVRAHGAHRRLLRSRAVAGRRSQAPPQRGRKTFTTVEGVVQQSPAPRFSRTPGAIHRAPVHAGTDTDSVLVSVGYSADEVAKLREVGAIR